MNRAQTTSHLLNLNNRQNCVVIKWKSPQSPFHSYRDTLDYCIIIYLSKHKLIKCVLLFDWEVSHAEYLYTFFLLQSKAIYTFFPLCENVHVRQIMCETLKNAVSKYFKGFFDVMCLEYDNFCHQGNLMGMCTINFD